MRVLLCEEPGRLRIAERPEPSPGPGELLLRIRRVGVCGTDLHIFQGKHPYLNYPRVMGHELAAEIAGKGAGAKLAEGTPVYVMPYLTCGRCVACRTGKTNCCMSLQCLGVHCDGGMAEYLVLPESVVFPMGDLPFHEAALVEFLAIGAHAARRAEIRGGERTLVVGAGPIGICTAMFAKARGAEITFIDPRRDRLDFCERELGLGKGVIVDDDTAAKLGDMTGGEYFDLVFDATGNARAMERSLAWVAHGGALVFVGVTRATIGFAGPEFHKRETTIKGSRNATVEDFREVIDSMATGRVKVANLITHRGSLEDAATQFPVWIKPETGVIKAMIEI